MPGPVSLVLVVLLVSVGARGATDSRLPSGPAQLSAPLVAWVTASEAPPAGAAPIVLDLSANVSGGSPPYREVWIPGDGRAESNPTNPYVLIYSGGQYRVVLTVTDSAGATATGTSFPFTPSDSWGGAAVQAGASVTFGVVPLAVQFEGTPSGLDGLVGNPVWYFGDGTPPVPGWNSSHTYLQPGSFAATLNASTPRGQNASYVITELVAAPSEPPYVVANATATFACGPNQVNLVNAVLWSEAAGGTPPYHYAWVFGDGSTGTGATVTHQYSGYVNPIAGPRFVPRVLVVDSRGVEATSSVPVEVAPPCGHPIGLIVDDAYWLFAWASVLLLGAAFGVGLWRLARRPPPRPPPGTSDRPALTLPYDPPK
ncbi:MAG: PKD domain-containing protein [Thermoplasmata archaeon]|nr:PKD domain-containing protein [Thermoplasmata archaeon]